MSSRLMAKARFTKLHVRYLETSKSDTADHETVYQLRNTHLPEFFNEFSECEVGSLEEMIKYNEKHATICMPPGMNPFWPR